MSYVITRNSWNDFRFYGGSSNSSIGRKKKFYLTHHMLKIRPVAAYNGRNGPFNLNILYLIEALDVNLLSSYSF